MFNKKYLLFVVFALLCFSVVHSERILSESPEKKEKIPEDDWRNKNYKGG